MKKTIQIILFCLLLPSSAFASDLEFKESSLKEVANAVSQLTHLNIVIPADVQARVSIFIPDGIKEDNLLKLFFSAVLSAGLAYERDKQNIYVKQPNTQVLNNPDTFKTFALSNPVDPSVLSFLPLGSRIFNTKDSTFIYTSNRFENFLTSVSEQAKREKLHPITQVVNLVNVKPSLFTTTPPPDLKLVPFDDLHKLVVTGNMKTVLDFIRTIKQIDKSVNMYKVDLIVISATENFAKTYNLNLSIANDLGTLSIGGGLVFDSVGSTQSLLNWINSNSSLNIVSKPYLYVLDGAKASLVVGQEVPFQTTKLDPNSQTREITTIERKDVGLQINVALNTLSDGKVRLNLHQEFSSIAKTQLTQSKDIITDKQSLDTVLNLTSGRFYLIGGLNYKDASKSSSDTPLLSSIPLIGKLASNYDNSSSGRDLLIFIKVSKVSNNLLPDPIS